MRVSVVPHPGQSLKFVVQYLKCLHVLLGEWCYLLLVLISIFLRTNDAELLFMCLLTNCIFFSLLQRLFKPLVHFLGGTIVLLLSFESTLFWVPALYQIFDELIFSPGLWFVFHSFNGAFQRVEGLNFDEILFTIFFSFMDCVFGIISKNLCLT